MSSRFAILEADIVEAKVSETVWTQLCTDPETAEVTTFDKIMTDAEDLFISECGGLFTSAANLALAKPQVCQVVVWQAHYRRASHTDLPIPEDIVRAKDAALKWARETGQKLLAAEGTVTPPGSGGIKYSADEATHKMSHLDAL